VPANIQGATDLNGEVAFLVQWKNKAKPSFVLSKTFRNIYPMMVIDFYEARIKFGEVQIGK
jgi:hypothetical protein